MPDVESTKPAAGPGRFAALPPRISLEDLVEEVDVSTPTDEPTADPNAEAATRWVAGPGGGR